MICQLVRPKLIADKVFSYPQLSIREQMAAYKEVIDGSSKEGFRRLTEKGREER